jgi:hypothetical protein
VPWHHLLLQEPQRILETEVTEQGQEIFARWQIELFFSSRNRKVMRGSPGGAKE